MNFRLRICFGFRASDFGFRHAGLLLALTLSGCGDNRFPIAPVAGTVTLNGKPLPGAHLLFQPERTGNEVEVGPESIGKTDDAGRFELATISPERKGAMIGKHRVSVTIIEEENRFGGGGGGGQVDDQGFVGRANYTLPERYRLGTDLVIDVPPDGLPELDLKLTSP